jgi:DNA polymerase III subunit gamma/tau
LLRGDMQAALSELRDQYNSGADPVSVLTDLADYTNFVTRVKVVPAVADDPAFSEGERSRAREFAASLSMRILSRTWQMLLKGIAEVNDAPKQLAAAEMVLVRIAYAADLPSPDELVRTLSEAADHSPPASARPSTSSTPSRSLPHREGSGGSARAATGAAPSHALQARSSPAPAQTPQAIVVSEFGQLIQLAGEARDLMMKTALERDVRLVAIEDGRLEIALEPGASKALVQELSRKLATWTGRPWMVAISSEQGETPARQQAQARQAAMTEGVRADPAVQAVLARFPGAEIVGVRLRADAMPGEPDETPPPDETEPD